jgi:hypothetical protein
MHAVRCEDVTQKQFHENALPAIPQSPLVLTPIEAEMRSLSAALVLAVVLYTAVLVTLWVVEAHF